jgi:hypothetical protein
MCPEGPAFLELAGAAFLMKYAQEFSDLASHPARIGYACDGGEDLYNSQHVVKFPTACAVYITFIRAVKPRDVDAVFFLHVCDLDNFDVHQLALRPIAILVLISQVLTSLAASPSCGCRSAQQ